MVKRLKPSFSTLRLLVKQAIICYLHFKRVAVKMVHVNFPPNLTEEEHILKQKYANLKKKVILSHTIERK